MNKVGVGVIGCGVISGAYLKAAQSFPILDIRGLADAVPAAAEARAKEFGLKAVSVDALLADPTIEIVLNLTVPKAHVEVGLKAIAAGKHVYGEKPLGVALQGRQAAGRRGKEKRPSRRLRARHVSRRLAPDLPQADRRGKDRRAGRRHRLFHVPRPRALASGAGLLLPAGRRADPRHGALLPDRPRQSARAGGARRRDDVDAAEYTHHHLEAARWRDNSGRGADARVGDAAVRLRRDRAAHA